MIGNGYGSRHSSIKPEADKDYTEEAKKRDCLRCRREFFSEHHGHRICIGCKKHQVFESSVAEHYSKGKKK